MVRKLFKHELEYYLRSLLPVYIVLGVVALVGRFVMFFEAETTAYEILQGSTIFMLMVCCLVTIFLTWLFSITRFYKNLFSSEGYLTMTLPVTPAQHIWVKLLGAVIAYVASCIAIFLAICLFTIGPWLVEIFKAVSYLFGEFAVESKGHFGWYLVEMIPMCLVSMASGMLVYYLCMCIGQLAKKNRILAAVGAYFGLYVLSQICSTVLTVVFSTTNILEPLGEWIVNLTEAQALGWGHGLIWIGTACAALGCLVTFLICRWILSRKLNLE